MTRTDSIAHQTPSIALDGEQPSAPASRFVIVERVHYGRYAAVAVILLFAAFVARSFAVGKIDWPLIGRFLFEHEMYTGMANTIALSVCSMAVGIALGLAAALMSSSGNPVLRYASQSYIFLFRAAPILLQLLIWYNLALVFPTLSVPGVFSLKTTAVITPFVAALLTFGIAQGAYTSEVIRSGLLSVGKGQVEAARSIGMTQAQTLRRIVIPQAMRVIVPPLGNEMIGMVKYTSLASIIQYKDIIYGAQSIYYNNGRVIELLIVCAIWYTGVVALLSIGQAFIERHYDRASRPTSPRGSAQ